MARMPEPDADAPATDPMLPRIARVRRRQRDIPDVFTLSLESADGASWDFVPGQFSMLAVFGVGEVPISISGDCAEATHLVHTIRAVGAVSRALTELKVGDEVGVRGPFGVGWPLHEAEGKDVIIVAGGLGLAPLRPLLYRLAAERSAYGRIVLLYGARHPVDVLFYPEFERWRRRANIDVQVTVDHATAQWEGHVGVVTRLISLLSFNPQRTVAFVCGPEIMMRFAIGALCDGGAPEHAVYLSMERNMKCAIGLCGHCQFGPTFICRDGPVFRYDHMHSLLSVREL